MNKPNVSTEYPQKNENTNVGDVAVLPASKNEKKKKCDLKILVVVPKYAPDIDKKKSPYFLPLGLMYVSSYLKKCGFDVIPLNLNHYENGKLQRVLEETQFDVMCTGGIFTELVPISDVLDIVKQLQSHIKIILGGALATADPDFAIEHLNMDYLVLGEGEVTIMDLCVAIANGSNVKDVKGIAFKENGKIFKTAIRDTLIADLNDHPYPDYEGFEYKYFIDNHSNINNTYSTIIDYKKRRVAFITTSRNCIAKCTFCYRLMAGGHRIRTIENTMGEIKHLIDTYGINEIELIDEMFANDKKRIYEFCEGIKPLGVRWLCQLRVGVIDQNVLKAMKESGCYYISYGFESASKAVLKSMKKGAHPKQFDDVIRWTSDVGIVIQGNWIFGDPAETLETMQETIDFRKKFSGITFGYGFIIPYPGTPLYDDLKAKGAFKDIIAFYKDPGAVSGEFPINMTKLSEDDFKYMCRKVWLEGKISVTHAKVLSSKKVDNKYHLIDFICPNCTRKHQDIKIAINGKLMLICQKCYQKISFNRSDLTFDLYDKLRIIYYHCILKPMLINKATYSIFAPVMTLLEGRGKIGGSIKKLLRGRS